jgi:molybdopterin-guanine dinucleotide biosynthesis protein A
MLAMSQKSARATGLKTRVIRRDLVPHCGPLGGIYSGLKTTKSDAVIFLACDMTFITPAIIQRLAGFGGLHLNRAAFLKTAYEFSFPLLVPYRALPTIISQIQKRRFSLQSLVARLRAKAIHCPSDWTVCLENINTPRELESARRRLLAGTLQFHSANPCS